LWLNIVTDGLQDIALSFEREEKEIMSEKPRSPKESIFNKLMFQEVMVAGLVMGLSVFFIWIYLVNVRDMELSLARGYVMMLMVFMQNLHALNCRSEKISTFKLPISRNWFILFSVVSSIVLQIFVMQNSFTSGLLGTQSLPIIDILFVFVCSIPILIVMEIFKKVKFRR
jgi:magnesium-transporting ATPase (P-type)